MLSPQPARNGLRRFLAAYKLQPMLVSVATGCIPIGVAFILLGERASRAFTSLGGDTPARMIGLAVFFAGVMTMVGIFSADSFNRALGAAGGVVGAALYGGGCYLGLGINGIGAGTFALSIAAGFFGHIIFVTDRKRPKPE